MAMVRNLLKFPRKELLRNGSVVHIERPNDPDISQIQQLVLESTASQSGGNPAEFSTKAALGDWFEFSQRSGLAVTAKLVKSEEIIGVHLGYPSEMPRSAAPLSWGGYSIVHPRHQRYGLHGILWKAYLSAAKVKGIKDCVGRVSSTNQASLSFVIGEPSTRITGCIPDSLKIPGIGLVDDFIVQLEITNNDSCLRMTREEMLKRIRKLKPVYLPKASFEGAPFNMSFSDVVIRDAKPEEEDDLYSLLSEAALAGDNFAVDEYPNRRIFREHFLNGRRLLSVVHHPAKRVIGVCVIGPSRLCRDTNPANAGFLSYLKDPFNVHYFRSGIYSALERYCEKCGFTGIMLEEYVRSTLPYKFLRERGYNMVGYVPHSGFLANQGWTDCLLLHKHLS